MGGVGMGSGPGVGPGFPGLGPGLSGTGGAGGVVGGSGLSLGMKRPHTGQAGWSTLECANARPFPTVGWSLTDHPWLLVCAGSSVRFWQRDDRRQPPVLCC